MALGLADRLLTIAVTATLTSAAWIVIGSGYRERLESGAAEAGPRPAGRAIAPAPDAAIAGELTIPVAGVTPGDLVDSFDDERDGERSHAAIDIMAPAGTSVLAAQAGTVERLFRSQAGGNTIYLRSADGRTLHYYAHLQGYAAGLAEGQRVNRGQPLGTVGSSGNAHAEAPHLHFAILRTAPDAEWWEPATAINPYPLLRANAEAAQAPPSNAKR